MPTLFLALCFGERNLFIEKKYNSASVALGQLRHCEDSLCTTLCCAWTSTDINSVKVSWGLSWRSPGTSRLKYYLTTMRSRTWVYRCISLAYAVIQSTCHSDAKFLKLCSQQNPTCARVRHSHGPRENQTDRDVTRYESLTISPNKSSWETSIDIHKCTGTYLINALN